MINEEDIINNREAVNARLEMQLGFADDPTLGLLLNNKETRFLMRDDRNKARAAKKARLSN